MYTLKTIKNSEKNVNRIINSKIKLIYLLSNLFLNQIDIYVILKNIFTIF